MNEYDGWGVATYVVILGEAEELADLGGALGAEALGVHDVGEAGDVGVALLDDAEGEDGEVLADDAAADGLALALAGAAGAVAGVAVGEEEADTEGLHDALLHGETLLVVAAGDAEDVALELVADGVTGDLGAHLCGFVSAFVVFVARPVRGVGWFGGTYALLHEDGELALILNVDELLGPVGRVGDVQLQADNISTRVSLIMSRMTAHPQLPSSLDQTPPSPEQRNFRCVSLGLRSTGLQSVEREFGKARG